MNPWFILIGLVVFFWLWRTSRGGGAQRGALAFGQSRARAVQNETATFKDVAGVDEAIDELREVVDFLKNPERYALLGARIPKGVMLVGPPGTGKTLLARAVAGEAAVPFFQMSGSDFVEMFVGVGAARVRDTFKKARESAPCIVFIDELDALGRARGSGMLAHEEREQTLNQLLVELDGFDAMRGIIVMAATNRPEILDGALLRAGRFDRHVLVDRPGKDGRRAILEIHVRNVQLDATVELGSVAARTPGLAGADLANLVNEAALLAARRGKTAVGAAEFDEAIERAAMGLEKKGRLLTEAERRIVAFHELGHAVVAEALPNADPVNRVTIIPRGMALGVTWQQPQDDTYVTLRSNLLDRIAVLLGGRAAEMLFIGEPSTGAHDDLTRATDLASDMVRRYGMTEVGARTFERARTALVNADQQASTPRDHSDQMANTIDREVTRLVAEGLQRAGEILQRHHDAVIALAGRLLETQQLSGAEVREGIGLPARVAASSPAETKPALTASIGGTPPVVDQQHRVEVKALGGKAALRDPSVA
ncbi:MAG: ATP-dependent zinc metalloprotease FtsH [Proteobacteria bacterium]|nr:ATP-dependent zinc metalloprotease FtsH [Pseudomonadota bacterium]